MTSWHTCLGSSLAAHHSSRFVILWWTKHAFWLLWVLVLCSFISSLWLVMGLKQASKLNLACFTVFEAVKLNEPFQTKVLVSASDQTLICWLLAPICTCLSNSQVRNGCIGGMQRCTVCNYPFSLSLAALPKEDLGGFYWRIFCHRFVWIAGK